MKAIDKILEHYRALPKHELYVPEWDLTIYWSELTAKEADDVIKKSRGNQAEQAVRLIAEKATDVDGNKLFEIGDALKLLRIAPLSIIQRVSTAMQADLINVEAAEKNS